MNWYARSAWVYENWAPGDSDAAKLKQHGIELVYIDPRSTNAAEVIQWLHDNGFGYGIYFDPSWFNWPSPLATAKLAAGYLSKLGLNGSFQPVMFDLETKSTAWVTAFLVAWRVLRPTRATAYTNSPFQGGFVPSLRLRLARVHVYVQLYEGEMQPVDSAAALLEIGRQGTPASMLHPFYDGAAIPGDSRDGCVFTYERIP